MLEELLPFKSLQDTLAWNESARRFKLEVPKREELRLEGKVLSALEEGSGFTVSVNGQTLEKSDIALLAADFATSSVRELDETRKREVEEKLKIFLLLEELATDIGLYEKGVDVFGLSFLHVHTTEKDLGLTDPHLAVGSLNIPNQYLGLNGEKHEGHPWEEFFFFSRSRDRVTAEDDNRKSELAQVLEAKPGVTGFLTEWEASSRTLSLKFEYLLLYLMRGVMIGEAPRLKAIHGNHKIAVEQREKYGDRGELQKAFDDYEKTLLDDDDRRHERLELLCQGRGCTDQRLKELWEQIEAELTLEVNKQDGDCQKRHRLADLYRQYMETDGGAEAVRAFLGALPPLDLPLQAYMRLIFRNPDGPPVPFSHVCIPVNLSSRDSEAGRLLGIENKALYAVAALKPSGGERISEHQLTHDLAVQCGDVFVVALSLLDFSKLIRLNREIKEKALQSAITQIMSRNISHNLGSHVISRVTANINSENIQDHRIFLTYLQQRMDFLAMISTDFRRPPTGHWFMKEVMQGFWKQRHVLNYIARAEGLRGFDLDESEAGGGRVKCLVRKQQDACSPVEECAPERNCNCALNGSHPPDGQSPYENDVYIDIPGGVLGFHAVYTIIENVIRNAAKHGYDRVRSDDKKDKGLEIVIEVRDCEKSSNQCFLLIWDNFSYVSGLVGDAEMSCPDKFPDLWKVCLSESDKLKCTDLGANGHLGSVDELEQSTSDETMWFVVDNIVGMEKRRKFVRKRNVRLVEHAQWKRFVEEGTKDVEAFLLQYLEPLHYRMNKALSNQFFGDDNIVRKENWGIGEIKIASQFLSGKPFALEQNAQAAPIITAVPVDNEGTFRLGYRFVLQRALDLIVITGDTVQLVAGGSAKPEKIGSPALEGTVAERGKEVDKWLKNLSRAKIVLDSHVEMPLWAVGGHVDVLKKLNEILQASAHAAQGLVDQSEDGILDWLDGLGRYALFLMVDQGKYLKKDNLGRLLKRVVLVCSKLGEADREENLKDVEDAWVRYLIEQLANGVAPVLVLKQESIGEDKPQYAGTKLDEIIEKAKLLEYMVSKGADENKAKYFIDNTTASKLILLKTAVLAWINSNVDRSVLDNKHGNATSEDYISFCNQTHIDRYAGFLKRMLSEEFGIGNESYMPRTLPGRTDSQQTELTGEICVGGVALQVVTDFNEGTAWENGILYVRHLTSKPAGVIYSEELTGAAAHFQQMRHLPAEKAMQWRLVGTMICNGLMRVLVADERLVETMNSNEGMRKELADAGVDPLWQFLGRKVVRESSGLGPPTVSIEMSEEEGSGRIMINKNGNQEPAETYHMMIIHQGVLEKCAEQQGNTDDVKKWIDDVLKRIRRTIPAVIVTSGRGEPEKLPLWARFVPFSTVEGALLARPHSKFLLIKELVN